MNGVGEATDGSALRALAALDDPSRRQLYEVVRTAQAPVTRESAADAVGISRKLAAFHLEKLVDAGLLVADVEAATRPRALGRPPKTYRRSSLALRISIPERRPEALAELLVDAVITAQAGEAPASAAMRVAYETGRSLGVEVRERKRPGRLGPERTLSLAADVLAARGFEPFRASATCVRLRNCPYLPMAEQSAQLVCGINHRHLSGLLDGLGAPDTVRAVLAPAPGRCCVELRAIEVKGAPRPPVC